jgi:carboxypeptidase Taq
MQAYRTLEQRFSRLSAIEDAIGILGWDRETTMPLGAAEGRAEQVATLEVMAHELLTSVEIADLLDGADQEASERDTARDPGRDPGRDPWQAANLREMRRVYTHATAVPADLVAARSRAVSRCEVAWRQARQDSDFAGLLPLLSEVLLCERQVGQAKGAALGLSPYDALLDGHDPGARRADIDPLFADLRAELPSLIENALAHQSTVPPPPPMQGPFPLEAQRGLGLRLVSMLGFDLQRGRVDVSTHPFCGGATDDVRITTRYKEEDFSSALMGVLHESGHGLYEQGRPRQWLSQPVGQARGMSMHESQSLLVEMQACRSRAFAVYLAPLVQQVFGAAAAAWDADALYRHYIRVQRGFIRVDADEVTYPAHILVRYEIEKALIAGDMALAELPAAFNTGIREMLGLIVPEDRLGCLQDIHWPGGAWGYFPTYTLGAMIAAQLFDAARRAEPDLMECIARGDFRPLVAWLRGHVHEAGSSLHTGEILTRATGRPLDAAVYRHHLRSRYLGEG